jgi:release factor glutamine methyltransferase
MTILELLRRTTEYFEKHEVEAARLTAELLLAEVLQKKRMQLYLEFESEVSEAALETLRPLVKRRAQREPIQYVQGFADFSGARFRVSPEVLIPRSETELLLEGAAKWIDPTSTFPVADIGTGSGILAISLARRFPSLTVHAVELSPGALALAQVNGDGLPNLEFFSGSLLAPLPAAAYQMIIANLPYLPTDLIPTLSPEVQREPLLALDGGQDGLDLVRELISSSQGRTSALALEIGEGQAESVKSLLLAANYFVKEVISDLRHVERIIIGTTCG